MVKPHDQLVPVSFEPLLAFHIRPINLVVYEGSLEVLRPGIPNLGGASRLYSFQRLSRPHIATRRCHWRDNRNTSGAFFSGPLVLEKAPSSILRPRRIGTELSHDVLNPARVPL